VVDESVHSKK